EPHGTIAHWEGDKVTLHDATQFVNGVKETVAKTLGIDPEQVRVISPFLGGGFGCKGSAWSHVLLATIAAREVKRPVKLILERPVRRAARSLSRAPWTSLRSRSAWIRWSCA